jgi:hypothetical protein
LTTIADQVFDRTTADTIPASKPQWQVPRHEIRHIVARFHVSIPMTEIDAEIQHRAALANCRARKAGKKPAFTKARIQACQTYARKCHADNIALFLRVARGV